MAKDIDKLHTIDDIIQKSYTESEENQVKYPVKKIENFDLLGNHKIASTGGVASLINSATSQNMTKRELYQENQNLPKIIIMQNVHHLNEYCANLELNSIDKTQTAKAVANSNQSAEKW